MMTKTAKRTPSRADAKVARLPKRVAATDVTDPERLLAALAAAERPEPAPPRRLIRVEVELLTAPVRRVVDATIALRENETAVRTSCGAFVVRRRPAARAA